MKEAKHSHLKGNLHSMEGFFFNTLNINNSPNAFKLLIKLIT